MTADLSGAWWLQRRACPWTVWLLVWTILSLLSCPQTYGVYAGPPCRAIGESPGRENSLSRAGWEAAQSQGRRALSPGLAGTRHSAISVMRIIKLGIVSTTPLRMDCAAVTCAAVTCVGRAHTLMSRSPPPSALVRKINTNLVYWFSGCFWRLLGNYRGNFQTKSCLRKL